MAMLNYQRVNNVKQSVEYGLTMGEWGYKKPSGHSWDLTIKYNEAELLVGSYQV